MKDLINTIRHKIFSTKNLAYFLYSISIAFSLVVLVHYLRTASADFGYYWEAGKRVQAGLSPYKVNDSSSYVNGPFLSIFLSQFGFLPLTVAQTLWRISIFLIALLIVFRISQESKIDHLQFSFLVVFTIIFLGFPYRNNLANAQVVVFCYGLIMLTLYYVKKNKEILAAVTSLLCFELKPYLLLGLLLYFFLSRRYGLIVKFIIISFFSNIFYFIFYHHLTYLDWLQALKYRSKGISSTADQANLTASLSNILNFSIGTATLIYVLTLVLLVSVTVWHELKLRQSSAILCLSLAPIISIFSHEQDYFISATCLAICILRSTKYPKYLFASLIGLSINWTNSSTQLAYVSLLILVLVFVAYFSFRENALVISCLIFFGMISIEIPTRIFKLQGMLPEYKIHNFMCYLYGLGVWLLILLTERSEFRLLKRNLRP